MAAGIVSALLTVAPAKTPEQALSMDALFAFSLIAARRAQMPRGSGGTGRLDGYTERADGTMERTLSDGSIERRFTSMDGLRNMLKGGPR